MLYLSYPYFISRIPATHQRLQNIQFPFHTHFMLRSAILPVTTASALVVPASYNFLFHIQSTPTPTQHNHHRKERIIISPTPQYLYYETNKKNGKHCVHLILTLITFYSSVLGFWKFIGLVLHNKIREDVAGYQRRAQKMPKKITFGER